MGNVIYFNDHARTSLEEPKKSGRIFSRGMPVSFSIWKTRTSGTPRSTQRVTVDLSTEHLRAKSECRSPFSASNIVSDFIISGESCTTHNASQGVLLRNPLTTKGPGVGILAGMSKKPAAKPQSAPLSEIFPAKQPARPHYLGRLMELRSLTNADLIKDLGVDKSQLSRWLDDDKPSTPGRKWARELGQYFAVPPDNEFVDIFVDPDVDWMYRLLRGKSAEERNRARTLLEAAFPAKRA